MARVFVSHAGRDRVIAGEVFSWLSGEGHELFYDDDLRAGLVAGEQWQDRLFERLRWADAVVCVITTAFVESAWCSAEIGIAISRGSRVVPVVVEAGVRHPLLAGIQFADYAGNRVAARTVVAEALRRVDSTGGRGWPDGRSPFPGLRPFDTDMNRVFFGRNAEVENLIELLRAPVARAERGMVVVTGPSGCGKSSLVRAGLLPAMADEPGWWMLPVMLPGTDPVGVLARELTGEARRLGLDWQLSDVRSRLDGRDVAAVIDELLLAAPVLTPQWRRLLIVVDQFEELLTLPASEDRAAFAEILRDAMAGSATIISTLRPEFLAALLGSVELGVLRPRPFLLRVLDREMLPEVILSPADLAGIAVHPELVGRLVADTGGGDALPLLAFTLQQLAADVPRGGRLSIIQYERLGGVSGALTSQADEAMLAATAGTARTPDEVLAGLLRLVSVDEHGTPIRTRVPVEDLPELVRVELAEFTARRLLTTDTENNQPVVGVAHDAFLTAWQPLAEAITRHDAALRSRRAVEAGAVQWDVAGRPGNRLWERGQLASALNDLDDPAGSAQSARTTASRGARRWSMLGGRKPGGPTIDLSPRAQEFLAASIRTDRRRRTRATTILTLLLVTAVAAAVVAAIQQRSALELQLSAEQQQRVATARQLLAQADSIADTDPRTAEGLALAASGLYPGPQTDAALFRHLVGSGMNATLGGHIGQLLSVAFSPDGHIAATGSSDGAVILWDVSTRGRPSQLGDPLTGHTGNVSLVAFTPDGHTLATGSSDSSPVQSDGKVILWDVADPSRPTRIGNPITSPVGGATLALTPDAHILAAGQYDGTVILWDLSDPSRPTRIGDPLTGHVGSVLSLSFSPDGHTLASVGSMDGTVILWKVDDQPPARIGPVIGAISGVYRMTFAPDGRTLATDDGRDGTVVLWDVTDPSRPIQVGQPLVDPGSSAQIGGTLAEQFQLGGPVVGALAFSADGHALATAGSRNTVILWDVSDQTRPTPIGQPRTGHTDAVNSLAFTTDGLTLATGSSDSTAILWDVIDPTQPTQIGEPIISPSGSGGSVVFAADGHPLAAGGSSGGPVVRWDVTDPTRPTPIGEPGEPTQIGPSTPYEPGSLVAFSPDGRTVASVGFDGKMTFWDITDPTRPIQLGVPLAHLAGTASFMAFTPDGHTLATGEADGTVALWDVTDPSRPSKIGDPLTSPNGRISLVAFTADGQTLASVGDDGTVILWAINNLTRPTPMGHSLASPVGPISLIAFAPDGHTLATGGENGTVILWDIVDPSRPTRIGDLVTGNNGPVFSVAFTPDGHTLATGSRDVGTVILWDITDPKQPTKIDDHLTNPLGWVSVAFTPDGHTLATGSESDGTIMLWDITGIANLHNSLRQRACTVTAQGLSPAEWLRYLPDLPYRNACSS